MVIRDLQTGERLEIIGQGCLVFEQDDGKVSSIFNDVLCVVFRAWPDLIID